MSQYYIGVKIIEAWVQEKNGLLGYGVRYPDGYISWSPKEQFERAYFPLGENATIITEKMVENFIDGYTTQKMDAKTALVRAELQTGFVQYETSSCVDSANFDMQVGEALCLKKIKDVVWLCLGFVLQWGRFGLKNTVGGGSINGK